MDRLTDKIILITGAAGAIGAATAAAIKREGGHAVTSDIAGRHGADHVLDVTLEKDWLRVMTAIADTHQRLDGLVNAAGIAIFGNVEDTDFSAWRQVLSVNLDGTFLGCKHAMPLLRRRGGAIVNLSSVSGLVGGYNLAAYNASKGGVRLLSKSIALYGARLDPKVRCNSLHPAFVEGPMVDAMLATTQDAQKARTRMEGSIPLGRMGTAAEIADLCVYLLSDESAFVTGAEFAIDGGLTAQ